MSNTPYSVWSDSVAESFAGDGKPSLNGNVATDVLVIGGGMAGLLTARRLKQAGVNCIVVEARRIGSGATGNTTAKITAQHGLIYADLINRFGREGARRHYEANTRAIADYRELHERFPCDFEHTTAYVYSTYSREKLEREAQAYHRLGINDTTADRLPLPFKTAGAVVMEGQAQFNPMKLLVALAGELNIFENTLVRKVDGNIAYTDGGRVKAKHIVFATHFPLVNIPGLYFLKLYQHRSYTVALEGAPQVGGMFVDEQQEGHSFRDYGNLLIIGGGDHRTGTEGGGYNVVRALAKRSYPQATERFSWAAQDCMTLDAIPYIGRHRKGTAAHLVATGFNKWGMSGSMVAARLLCELIVHGRSELEQLYSPSRSIWTKQLAQNAGHAAMGLLSIGGPRCAHMGCKLHKNSTDGTWECACHGSRYERGGALIDNPAKRGIDV